MLLSATGTAGKQPVPTTSREGTYSSRDTKTAKTTGIYELQEGYQQQQKQRQGYQQTAETTGIYDLEQ
jgi:hypothetical protein